MTTIRENLDRDDLKETATAFEILEARNEKRPQPVALLRGLMPTLTGQPIDAAFARSMLDTLAKRYARHRTPAPALGIIRQDGIPAGLNSLEALRSHVITHGTEDARGWSLIAKYTGSAYPVQIIATRGAAIYLHLEWQKSAPQEFDEVLAERWLKLLEVRKVEV